MRRFLYAFIGTVWHVAVVIWGLPLIVDPVSMSGVIGYFAGSMFLLALTAPAWKYR